MNIPQGARLSGDDFQHLYSWWLVLMLKIEDEKVTQVIVEDKNARSVDDVTVTNIITEDQDSIDDVTIKYKTGTIVPDRFYQVKYHIDQRSAYSAQELIKPIKKKESQLQKFWYTWQHLRQENPDRAIELYLVSNWTWGQDALGKWVGGQKDSIYVDGFLDPHAPKDIKTIKESWQNHLQAKDQEFRAFIGCLHFRLGYSASVLVNEQVVERMRHLKLKTEIENLASSSTIVRSWIKNYQNVITLDILNAALKEYKLYLPIEEERCLTIYIESIEERAYFRKADHRLMWRKYFLEIEKLGGHQLKNPDNWNERLLPQLYNLKDKIRKETDCRFIRAYGQARLSCWFAFGFTFSEVAGYEIEVDQHKKIWRTDTEPSDTFSLLITNPQDSTYGEMLDEGGDTVALGISISASLDKSVRKYLDQRQEKVSALLLLAQPELGRHLQEASEVTALAKQVKEHVKKLIECWNAKKILIFYQGPFSGACFIGHRFNAIPAEIQIMEDQNPGYAPSFLLR